MCVTAVSSFCPKCLKTGGQDQERKHKKRRGEFYSIQTSLIVAALKKMLPIGLNMCTPGDQELISLAKTRYLLVSPGSHGATLPGTRRKNRPMLD